MLAHRCDHARCRCAEEEPASAHSGQHARQCEQHDEQAGVDFSEIGVGAEWVNCRDQQPAVRRRHVSEDAGQDQFHQANRRRAPVGDDAKVERFRADRVADEIDGRQKLHRRQQQRGRDCGAEGDCDSFRFVSSFGIAQNSKNRVAADDRPRLHHARRLAEDPLHGQDGGERKETRGRSRIEEAHQQPERERQPGNRKKDRELRRQRNVASAEDEGDAAECGRRDRHAEAPQQEEHPNHRDGEVQQDVQLYAEMERQHINEPLRRIEKLVRRIGRERRAAGVEPVPVRKFAAAHGLAHNMLHRIVVNANVADVEAAAENENVGIRDRKQREQQRNRGAVGPNLHACST